MTRKEKRYIAPQTMTYRMETEALLAADSLNSQVDGEPSTSIDESGDDWDGGIDSKETTLEP